MKRLGMFFLIGASIIGITASAFASNWDVAGKVLTGVEGIRIVTGGKIDPIGKMIEFVQGGPQQVRQEERYAYRYNDRETYRREWVPHYAWKKKYIPQHSEYSEKYGQIIVEAHYIRYQVEEGGHWEDKYDRDEGRDKGSYRGRD